MQPGIDLQSIGATLTGPYWPEPILVLSRTVSAHGFVSVQAWGEESGRFYSTTLPADQWETLAPAKETIPTFRADPVEFKLALEARRLELAYSCDPLLATNN